MKDEIKANKDYKKHFHLNTHFEVAYIDELVQELQRKDNIIKELKENINNFDVFKEFTFPLMKRDEEQQVISSIDYEWRKSIKEPFLNKIKEIESK